MSMFNDIGHFVPEERPEMTAWHMDDSFREQTSFSELPAAPERTSLQGGVAVRNEPAVIVNGPGPPHELIAQKRGIPAL